MLNELQLIALQKEIERQLKERNREIMEEITIGCEHTDSTEVICGKMIVNAIAISARISAGMLFDILIDAGIAEPRSDSELRRQNLSIVKRKDV